MVQSREGRREARRERVTAVFSGEAAGAALDLLEILEFAWHDCHGEASPTEDVVDMVILCSQGRMDRLVEAARVALADMRDLVLWAQSVE